MKILFLVPYPLGKAPSQRFRFEQYLHLLDKTKMEWNCQSFWSLETWTVLYKPGHLFTKISGLLSGFARRSLILFRLSHVDFVFIHRECTPIGPPLFEWIIAKIFKKKIIYDFDDAIWLPNTSEENKLASFLKWHSKTSSICLWSYKISAGNDYLADYARRFNKNVVVNPTTIDTQHLHNSARYEKRAIGKEVTIGWTGSHSTLSYLNELTEVFQNMERKNSDIQILIIANRAPHLPLTKFKFLPWSIETETEDLLKIDIGVMPLPDDEWAKGKCGFKALQYMALGIPALASPVGVNNQIIKDGADGFLCKTKEEWQTKIERLINDPEMRIKIGNQGRMKVEADYSVISNSQRFICLFE